MQNIRVISKLFDFRKWLLCVHMIISFISVQFCSNNFYFVETPFVATDSNEKNTRE